MRADQNVHIRGGYAKGNGPTTWQKNVRRGLIAATLIGAEVGLAWRYFFYEKVTDEVLFLRKIHVVEYGPPGKAKIGRTHDASTAIVAPSLCPEVTRTLPSPRVQRFITRPGDAIFDQNVITVGMERTTRPTAEVLIKSYRNVLHEFANSACSRLRLTPLAGHNIPPYATMEALRSGFNDLHVSDQQILSGKTDYWKEGPTIHPKYIDLFLVPCLGRGCTHPNATNFSVRTGVLHTRQRRPGLRKREVLHRDTPRMNSIYTIALHLFFPPVPGADLPSGYLVRHRLEHGGLLFWPSCRSHA